MNKKTWCILVMFHMLNHYQKIIWYTKHTVCKQLPTIAPKNHRYKMSVSSTDPHYYRHNKLVTEKQLLRHCSGVVHSALATTDCRETAWFIAICCYLSKEASKLLTYPLNIAYNGQALTVTENIKFLGMHLECNLTWKSHI
jgi:hypothetical protein